MNPCTTPNCEAVSRCPRPVRHRRRRHRHRDRWPDSRHDGECSLLALARSDSGAVLPGEARALLAAAAAASGFSVNFLRDEQEALSTYFAGQLARPRAALIPVRRHRRAATIRRLSRLAPLLEARRLRSRRSLAGDARGAPAAPRHRAASAAPVFPGKIPADRRSDGDRSPGSRHTADEPAQMYYHEP